jgi:GntR family transcriptional regulator/MocR family aminotransferase
VRERLNGVLEVSGIEAGLQTTAWLPPGIDPKAVQRRAREHGLAVNVLSDVARRPLRRDGLQLGFAAVGPDEIRDGVRVLERVLDELG